MCAGDWPKDGEMVNYIGYDQGQSDSRKPEISLIAFYEKCAGYSDDAYVAMMDAKAHCDG